MLVSSNVFAIAVFNIFQHYFLLSGLLLYASLWVGQAAYLGVSVPASLPGILSVIITLCVCLPIFACSLEPTHRNKPEYLV